MLFDDGINEHQQSTGRPPEKSSINTSNALNSAWSEKWRWNHGLENFRESAVSFFIGNAYLHKVKQNVYFFERKDEEWNYSEVITWQYLGFWGRQKEKLLKTLFYIFNLVNVYNS